MPDQIDRQSAAAAELGGDWLLFSLAGDHFGLPMGMVEAISAPPPIAAVPHAPPALLGAGNIGGQILPIVDIARLLASRREAPAYDGSGEIVRLRTPGGSVGVWVDRVDRLTRVGAAADGALHSGSDVELGDISLVDPPSLLGFGLRPPALAASASGPLGDVAETAAVELAPVIDEAFIVVEVSGRRLQLRRENVLELVEAMAWTPMPRAPAGLCGVGVLRGEAFPILSLAALLHLPEPEAPGGFAMITVAGYAALLAVDRIVGLRFGHGPEAANDADDGTTIEVDQLMSDELRQVVLGFALAENFAAPETRQALVEYLVFSVSQQDFAVPIASVERIVGPQPLIRLPRTRDETHLAGAIELRGQILPVAALRSRFDLGDEEAGAGLAGYVILQGPEGLGAVAVDQIKQVEPVNPAEIAVPSSEHPLLQGVAVSRNGELLRIISLERLWNRE